MNNETKILLTLYKEGGTLIRQDVEEREFVLTKKDISPSQKFKGNEGNKIVKKGKYTIVPMKQAIVTQQIRMTVDAYDYMTSSMCPDWYKDVKKWRKLSQDDRLKLHLERTKQHFGAIKYSYSMVD